MDEYTVTKMDTIMDLYYLERRKAFQKAPVNGHEEKKTEMKKRITEEMPANKNGHCSSSPNSLNAHHVRIIIPYCLFFTPI